MKEFRLVEKKTLEKREGIKLDLTENMIKIKVSKAGLLYKDMLIYNGEIGKTGIVPIENGVGIISDYFDNTSPYNKGERAFIDKYIPCNSCYSCKTNKKVLCTSMGVMGCEFDGFLTDFKVVPSDNVIMLPENVTDEQALFINLIASAISVIGKLDVEKGEHVVIFGSDILSNLIAQIALYYQTVPILVDNNEFNCDIAKKRGIYYIISDDAKAEHMINEITGGRLAENLVYCTMSNFSTKNVISCCSPGAKVVFTEVQQKATSFDLRQAYNKQLNISFVSNGFGNVSTAINMLANKAVLVESFLSKKYSFDDVATAYQEMETKKVNEKLVQMSIINI